MSIQLVPRQVRVAGALVGLQGLVGVAFIVALVVRAASAKPGEGPNIYGEAGIFGIFAAGVLAVGLGLLRGKRWARTPAAVLQVLLIGVGWYAIVGSGRPDMGLPVVALCVCVLVLLFVAPSRVWAFGEDRRDTDAAGGTQGR